MKRTLCLLLAAVMLLSLLAACGKKEAPAPADTDAVNTEGADIDFEFDTPDMSYNPGPIDSTTPEIDVEFDTPDMTYDPGEIEAGEPAVDAEAETPDMSYNPGEIESVVPSITDFEFDVPDISYNPGEIESVTPSITDFEFDVPRFSYNPPAIESIAPNIEIVIEVPDFTYDVKPIESSAPSIVDMELSDDLDAIEGLESAGIQEGSFAFAIPDMEYEFDESTFDAEAFIAASEGNLSEEDRGLLSQLDTQTLMGIAETKASLMADLSIAFQSSGLAVTVDETTGEIMVDSAILFAVNEDSVSELGAAMLRRVMTVYVSVLFSEKYQGFVDEVLVEGHTDTNGDYNYNLDLSQRRADNVTAWCLSSESGLDNKTVAILSETLTPVGRSYDMPILDEAGNVDMDASRRVSFRFLMDIG